MSVQDSVRAHLLRFVCLAGRRRKSRDMTTPLVGELQSQVPQSADTNDTDVIGRLDIELYQRIENRHTAAKQWPRFSDVNTFRNRSGPNPVAANTCGECAMSMDNGRFAGIAHLVIAREALPAMQATAGVPT